MDRKSRARSFFGITKKQPDARVLDNSKKDGKGFKVVGMVPSTAIRRKTEDVPVSCRIFRTRGSEDDDMIQNDIENPKPPFFYKPPFRRNFRYFGYPRDLNPDLDTPPRVRSWGPIPEQIPRVKPARTRYAPNFEEGLDPYWPGRLLKNCTMLENPTLVPVMGKAVQNLGRKPVPLVKPELDLANCVSQLYFPLSEKSRNAFCRINKIIKEDMAKTARDFEVQNPKLRHQTMSQKEVRRSETTSKLKWRKSKAALALETQNKAKRPTRFSLVNLERKIEEILFYERANTPQVLQIFCHPDSHPGKNKQLYGRPAGEEDKVEAKEISTDGEFPLSSDLKNAYQHFSVPEDLWERLNKVRARKKLMERAKAISNKKEMEKEFKTFTQLQMRNEVLGMAKQNFIENLTRNVNTPLPPELFEDNRDKVQPPHDYLCNDELPAQGPFYWKTESEGPANEVEDELIDRYIETLKEHHNFSHHLPGLVYISRHPFPVLELDWYEPDADMGPAFSAKRKSPKTFHDIPYYIAQLNEEKFEEQFEQATRETAKDLIGPEIYEMYKQLKGIRSHVPSQHEIETVDAPKKVRKVRKSREPKKAKKEEEEGVDEEEAEDEADEEKEEEDVEAVGEKEATLEPDVEEPVFYLEHDLQEEEEFPLPDVRFSDVSFHADELPSDVLSDTEAKLFRKMLDSLEFTEPIRKDEEEPQGSDKASESTNSDIDLSEPPPPKGEDPTEHLQEIYQEAVRARARSRVIRNVDLKPPELKDVFLQNTYIGDIENLLHSNLHVPAFLQLDTF